MKTLLRLLSPKRWHHATSPCAKETAPGFTAIELIVVIVIIGILASIMAMAWLAFLNVRRLNSAQSLMYTVIRAAQAQAKQRYIIRQASFREVSGQLQWAIHGVGEPSTTVNWEGFGESVRIDAENTTLYKNKTQNRWRVQFNHKGHVNGRLGRITVTGPHGGATKRCIFVSTLLGALRRDEDKDCRK